MQEISLNSKTKKESQKRFFLKKVLLKTKFYTPCHGKGLKDSFESSFCKLRSLIVPVYLFASKSWNSVYIYL